MANNKISQTTKKLSQIFNSEKQPAIFFDKNVSTIEENNSLLDGQTDVPVLDPHDLLVEVQAVSVNPVDTKLRQTGVASKIKILGYDAFGIVKNTGKDVTRFHAGDRVYYAGTTQRPGSNEKFQAVDERLVGRAPEKLNKSEIAAMPLTSITAYEILVDQLGLRFQNHAADGKNMLVINGAGGVGSVLLQMAAYLGINLSVTAHSSESIEWLKKYSVDKIYDYENIDETLADQKFDYIVFLYDPALYWDVAIKHIKPYGQLVSIVGTNKPLNMGPLKNIAVQFKWEYMFAKSDFNHNILSQGQALDKIAILLDAGILKTTLNKTFDLINAENLRQAYKLVESGRMQGKVVLNRAVRQGFKVTSRFFLENSQEFLSGNKISKKNNPDVFHHLKDVLRVKDKDLVELVADQSVYLVQVNEISAMEVFFNRLDKLSKDPEIPVKTTIVVPLLKSDHLDWLIQKATELGVFKIILTNFSYSVVKDTKIEKKLQRYEKIVKGAAEQSHRLLVPEIIYEKKFIEQAGLSDHQIGIVAWEESAKSGEKSNLFKMIRLAKRDSKFNEIVAVFGPEGGISKKEIKKLESSGFIAAGLGPRILRAETAPLYLLSSVSLLIELS